jgi:PleD family two-component response regulator
MNPHPDTILVVDDTPANLGVLFTGLRNAGYKVLLNENGEAALKTAMEVMPNLIILDIIMPGTDGFEICRRLKANTRTRDIPVIFMTALTDPVDEVKGLRLGAVDYISKPIKVEIVLARLNTHLTLRKIQKELEQRNLELQEALDAIKTLSGLVPICAWCGKNIRNELDEWVSVTSYIEAHSEIEFTHGLCPDCSEGLHAEIGSIKRAG